MGILKNFMNFKELVALILHMYMTATRKCDCSSRATPIFVQWTVTCYRKWHDVKNRFESAQGSFTIMTKELRL